MIYTITFNPALDYIIKIDNYKEGTVNRTSSESLFAGGKGINVSIVLKNLGFENTALGFTAGFTGDFIEAMLIKSGIKTDFIRLRSGYSRINLKIKSEYETEINGNGPEICDDAIKELYAKLSFLNDDDILIISGSIPSCLPDTIYCDIMKYLRHKNLKIIVDAVGKLLTSTLIYKPFLIKPNNFELEEIVGAKLKTSEEIAEAAKALQRFGAQNVLVSMGGSGALLATEHGTVLIAAAPTGKVVNTTGAGDSMVAGFIAGYLEKKDYSHALKLGIAAGSSSAFSENLATGDEIRTLFKVME